ncbi:hypothetical protein AC249_AIPGENE3259 [Exaiptasia diaphana]|nr:hypothetical protein AC249_AIPGENE3259 [Exaiptasia diaphana]
MTQYNTSKAADRIYSSGATTPKTPLSDAGSNSEAASAFDAIASGGPLTVDASGDFGFELGGNLHSKALSQLGLLLLRSFESKLNTRN